MGLSEIAAGLEVTTEQRDRGVLAVDDTDADLADRLAPYADDLPCSPERAARLVEAYSEGAAVGRAAAVAEVPETTAAKTLYLVGEPIEPLSPTARAVLEDWLAGELARSDALAMAGVGEREFALGAYVATHEPIAGASEAVASALAVAAVEEEDPLADARGSVDEWL